MDEGTGGTPGRREAGSAAGVTTFSTILVWLLGYFQVVSLSAEAGAAIAGGITTVLLFVWHVGLLNIGRQLLKGDRLHRAAPAAK
jgi:hypothetical protein